MIFPESLMAFLGMTVETFILLGELGFRVSIKNALLKYWVEPSGCEEKKEKNQTYQISEN